MRFITMMGTAALSMTAATLAQSTTINEIRTGASNAEYIEFKGTPGASMAGLTFIIVGDGVSTTTKTGVIEWIYRFAATDVIGSNGYLVLHNPGANPNYATTAVPPVPGPDPATGAFPFTIDPAATNLPWGYQTPTGSVGDTQIESPDNMTFMLVSDFTGTDTYQTRAPSSGAGGQDLDTNDDGVFDITPWSAILDSVAFKETNGTTPSASQDWWYSTNTCGPYSSRSIQTSGAPIALWTMPTAVSGTLTAASYVYGPADQGPNATGSNLRGVHALASSVWSSPAGTASGGNAATLSLSSNGWSINDYYEVTASTIGFTGVTLQWDHYRSSTGPATFRVDMSVDGGANFTTVLDTYTLPSASWASKSIASIPNAGNQASVMFRFIDIAATGAATGTNRIDNVLIRSDSNQNTVLTSYAGPTMGIKQANGAWFVGAASTTVGFQDTPGSLNYEAPTYTCGDPNAGDCAVAHGNGFCADSCCCAYVCGLDAYCCTTQWDAICVTAAAACATNCTGTACPADFDADRTVAGADLGILLGGWGGPDQDLNADGIVNGADLGILLGAWGACP